MSASTEEVTSSFGQSFTVDTSDDACTKASGGHLKHGDRFQVVLIGSREGVVVGAAPPPEDVPAGCMGAGANVLWVRLDGNDSVCFFPNPGTGLQKI